MRETRQGERRERLGGGVPSRGMVAPPLEVPDLSIFEPLLEGTDGREISTTSSATCWICPDAEQAIWKS